MMFRVSAGYPMMHLIEAAEAKEWFLEVSLCPEFHHKKLSCHTINGYAMAMEPNLLLQ